MTTSMRTTPLATYALHQMRTCKPPKTLSNHELEIVQELNHELIKVNAATLKTEIDNQLFAIKDQGGHIVIYIGPNIKNTPTNKKLVRALLKESSEFQRIKKLAKDEGFTKLTPIVQDSTVGSSCLVLLLRFKLPESTA